MMIAGTGPLSFVGNLGTNNPPHFSSVKSTGPNFNLGILFLFIKSLRAQVLNSTITI